MAVTHQEYALLAADAYNGDGASTANVFPSGWNKVSLTPDYDEIDSDFSATAYTNGTEIVIAYRGTDGTVELLADSIFNNVTGIPSKQVLDAYKFYQAVVAQNPGATISFTGHSLGGSLAAIMSAHTGLDGQSEGASLNRRR